VKFSKIERAIKSANKHKNRANYRKKKENFKILNRAISYIGIEDYARITGRD